MPGRIVVCRVIPNPGVGMLNLFMSLLLCVLNGSCSRRPGLTPFRQEHTRDSFPCTVLTLRKVLPRGCYNGDAGVCVSELKPASIFLPGTLPTRPGTCRSRLGRGTGGPPLTPGVPSMDRSQEQTQGEGTITLSIPGGACDGLFARTYT